MAKKKRTFGEKMKAKKTETFVGRAKEVNVFKENSQCDIYDDDDFKNIFNIYGNGGVGKTTLLNKFKAISKQEDYKIVCIDGENKDFFNVLDFMNAVAKQLDEGKAFKVFEERYKVYWQHKKRLEADPEKPQGALLSGLVSAATKGAIDFAAAAVPAGAAMKQLLPTERLATATGEWASFIHKKITNKDEVQLLLEPWKVLSPLWVEGLDTVSDKQKIALFIDTFEATNPELEQWLSNLFQLKYGDIPVFLMAISGRKPLPQEKWKKYKEVMVSFSLEPFSEEEAQSYLAAKGIDNAEQVQALCAISGRLPLFLALLLEADWQDVDVRLNSNEEVVKRFLKHIKEPIERSLVLDVALPNLINLDIIACLLPEEEKTKAEQYFEWIKQRPFTERRGGNWTYHPVVRELMLRYWMVEQSEEKWERLHGALADWYKTKREKQEIQGTREQWIQDKTWRKYLVEWHFHCLSQNYKRDLTAFFQDFIISLYYWHKAVCQSLVECLRIVESTLSLENPWANVLSMGLDELIHQDNKASKAALQMFTRINKEIVVEGSIYESYLHFAQALYEPEISAKLENYEKAVSINPAYADAWNNMGNVYGKQGALDRAISSYKEAVSINPAYAFAWYNMGNVYGKQGALDRAISSYKEAVSINPAYAVAWYNMGNVYGKQGALDRAISSYKEAVSINPAYAFAWYNMGNVYVKQGDLEAAISSYKEAVSIEPAAAAWYNMGNIYVKQGDLDAAISSYKESVSINPADAVAWYNMGNIYVKQGDLDAAISSYKESVSINPADAVAWYNMGNIYVKQGDLEAAISSYKESISINPADADAWYNMGKAYSIQGDLEAAISSYKESVSINPAYAVAWYNMGNIYVKQGDLEAAISSYKESVSINPAYAVAWYNMGSVYGNQGDLDAALESYKKSVSINPADAAAWYNMGKAYSIQGDLEKAYNSYYKAWEQSEHSDARTATCLGHVCLLQQDIEKAIQWYKEGRALWQHDDKSFVQWLQQIYMFFEMEKKGVTAEAFQQILAQLGLSE